MTHPATASLADLPADSSSHRHRAAWIEFALAVGAFGVGAGEFASMGILPNVANGLLVTEPQAGHMISAYALGVVVGAPVIAVLSARMARRTLLLWLMVVFTAANAASALANGYYQLIGFRFLAGLPHGAYFGVSFLVAAGMAEPNRRAQAVGRVMMGITLATLVGSPLATWLGQALGWRLAFATVGAIGALTAVLILAFMPLDKVQPGASPLRELGALKRKQVWLTLAIPAIGLGGMFAVYTYVASTLTQLSGFSPAFVPVALVLFGIGMNVGNIAGSWLADRALMPTIGGMLVWVTVVMALYSLTATNPWMISLCIFLIGCNFAICPAIQTRLMDVAGDAQTLAAALNHSAFNIANALGAWLGGVAVAAGFGWASTGWVGALLAVAGLMVFLVSWILERADRREPEAAAVAG
ncbi:MFS transporter [Labrys sp. KB_33_2]|uniref:MFS transporter n=1 Tax=Labrys sp. KB_33_2 TaxID=3237479 RepID=UPI003F924447